MRKFEISEVQNEFYKLSDRETLIQKMKKYMHNIEKVDEDFYRIKENEEYDLECEKYIANRILLGKYNERIEKKFESSVDIIDSYNTLKMWELLSGSSSQKKGKRIMDEFTKKVIIKDLRKHLREGETISEKEVEEYLRLLTERDECEKEMKKKDLNIPQELLIYADDHMEGLKRQKDNYDTLKYFVEQGIESLPLDDDECQKWLEIVRDISLFWSEEEVYELKQKISQI